MDSGLIRPSLPSIAANHDLNGSTRPHASIFIRPKASNQLVANPDDLGRVGIVAIWLIYNRPFGAPGHAVLFGTYRLYVEWLSNTRVTGLEDSDLCLRAGSYV